MMTMSRQHSKVSGAYCFRNFQSGKDPTTPLGGSMGFPFIIGESIPFFSRDSSFDIPPFIKDRVRRYGPVFKTSLVGRPVVVSNDPEFSHYIFQQDGKLFGFWYLDSVTKLLGEDGLTSANSSITAHKYFKDMILNHFSRESVREKMVPEVEMMARQSLRSWCNLPEVEVRDATSKMIFDLSAKQLLGYDSSKYAKNNMRDMFEALWRILLLFP